MTAIAILCGLAVALAGTYGLEVISNRAKAYAFPALMAFLCTQVLGYLVAGEPFGTHFFAGWILGLFPFIGWRAWSEFKAIKNKL